MTLTVIEGGRTDRPKDATEIHIEACRRVAAVMTAEANQAPTQPTADGWAHWAQRLRDQADELEASR